MSNKDNNNVSAWADVSADLPTKSVACAIKLVEVDVENEVIEGHFAMKTMEGFVFWFTWNAKYRLPNLGKLERNPKIRPAIRMAAKRRIKEGLHKAAAQYGEGHLSQCEIGKWLMVQVKETDWYAND